VLFYISGLGIYISGLGIYISGPGTYISGPETKKAKKRNNNQISGQSFAILIIMCNFAG
jgi:hypothetical protein